MRHDQIIYFGLVIVSIVCLGMGIWIFLYAEKFFAQRSHAAQQRLGPKVVVFLIGTMRVLGFLLMIVSTYLVIRLLQILPCALK